MNIKLNGEKRELPDGLTVRAMLRHIGIQPERVAVEINEQIIRKATYDDAVVRYSDSVEVVQIKGGG
ncbi:MAG: sulfur carrier protein ThiS [Methylococcaceae bacterium]|nr:sulfur carrier protein ThiS [Methylococcaceae bacterium]